MVRKTDWDAVRQENKSLEAYLGEWCMKGEVSYLRKWAWELAEIRAIDLGIKLESPGYVKLHLVSRNEVLWQTVTYVSDIRDKSPSDSSAISPPLVTYEDMVKILESIRKISPPVSQESSNVTKYSVLEREDAVDYGDSDEGAYRAEKYLTHQIECSLLKFIDYEDLMALRRASFEYADKKARSYGFLRKSDKYLYLQAVVRHELMTEAEEYIEGFSDGNRKTSSDIVKGLLKHNDLGLFLKEYDSKFRKS